MSNKRFDLFGRLQEIPSLVYAVLGALCLVVQVLLCTYDTKILPTQSGMVLIVLYIVAVTIIALAINKRLKFFKRASDASDEQNEGVIHTFRDLFKIPYAVVTENGKIVTVNAAMKNIAGVKETMFNSDITSICKISMEHFTASTISAEDASEEEVGENEDVLKDKPATCEIDGRIYHIDCHKMYSKSKPFYMLVFNDITDLTNLSNLHRALHTAVAYIAIDNLDEIAQYAKVSFQAEINQVDTMLKDWAKSLGAILREYDKDKYMLLMTRQSLSNCIKNKFEILDRVREIHLGDDNIPITISMGITTMGTTLAERERESLVCLEMALQRGGDQVVLKNEQGPFFFGGRTKSQQKRSSSHSRVIAAKLCSMIQNAPNVLIMGHANPDFDSIGACVGIYVLCNYLKANAKIVTNLKSENFKACTSRLRELTDYRDAFVDGVAGLEKIQFGTLLIIVDANNMRILEAPEIAANCYNLAIIDHHIKKEEFEYEPPLPYIDPSASSACELISEILEFTIPVETLRKEEANVIMSGIMVDTQNFTRTVGTRTFAAALYLRGAGASPEYARTFFEQAFEDYHSEAMFSTNAQIYNEEIAITASEGTGSPSDRVTAAKAADRLLAVKNVNAAFALVQVGNLVHISGRSNGKINVQLILEKIGGGGHFDVAGAALADSGLNEAKTKLIGAINAYYADISSENK